MLRERSLGDPRPATARWRGSAAATAVVLVVVSGVAGCGGAADSAPPGAPPRAVPSTAPATAPASAGQPSTGQPGAGQPSTGQPGAGQANTAQTSAAPSADPAEFNGTDAAWLPLVLAMHERVDPVLALGERRGAGPAVRRLAADARAAHRARAARLRALIAAAGLPADNPHRSHDMPGMPTAATVDALAAARGDEFDRLFAAALRAHLDQLVRLADGVLASGRSPRVRDLAGAVRRDAVSMSSELGPAQR